MLQSLAASNHQASWRPGMVCQQARSEPMAARYAVGVDVGGTKIYAGIIDVNTGQVLGTARRRTHSERGEGFFSERLISVIETVLNETQIPGDGIPESIGVGIAGQVDRGN